MAHEHGILDWSLKSSGDMSSNQYRAVQFSTTNAEDGAVLVAARGARVDGVWQDNSTETTFGKVRLLGVSKVAAGDSSAMENAISLGTSLIASSNGHAVPSTAANLPLIGKSLGTLSTGSTGVISVFLTPGARSTA